MRCQEKKRGFANAVGAGAAIIKLEGGITMTKQDFQDFAAIRAHVRRAKAIQRRNEVIRRVLAVLALLAVAALLIGSGFDSRTARKAAFTEDVYIVQRGDTLWGIAERYSPEWMDKRDYIEEVKKDNSCGTLIRTGDVLTVRVYDAK